MYGQHQAVGRIREVIGRERSQSFDQHIIACFEAGDHIGQRRIRLGINDNGIMVGWIAAGVNNITVWAAAAGAKRSRGARAKRSFRACSTHTGTREFGDGGRTWAASSNAGFCQK